MRFDRSEIELIERILVFRQPQFPQGEEVLADIQPLLATLRAVDKLMANIKAELPQILGRLVRFIPFPSRKCSAGKSVDLVYSRFCPDSKNKFDLPDAKELCNSAPSRVSPDARFALASRGD
jgi:hypothetical protein